MSLSEKLRPDVEAAPWVIEEVKRLEEKLAIHERIHATIPRMSEAKTLEQWKMLAEHYVHQWAQCSEWANRRVGELNEANKRAKREALLEAADYYDSIPGRESFGGTIADELRERAMK